MTDDTDYMRVTFTLNGEITTGISVCPVWDDTDCVKVAQELIYDIRSILAFQDRTKYDNLNKLIDWLYTHEMPLKCQVALSVTRPKGNEFECKDYGFATFEIDKGFMGGRRLVSFENTTAESIKRESEERLDV